MRACVRTARAYVRIRLRAVGLHMRAHARLCSWRLIGLTDTHTYVRACAPARSLPQVAQKTAALAVAGPVDLEEENADSAGGVSAACPAAVGEDEFPQPGTPKASGRPSAATPPLLLDALGEAPRDFSTAPADVCSCVSMCVRTCVRTHSLSREHTFEAVATHAACQGWRPWWPDSYVRTCARA